MLWPLCQVSKKHEGLLSITHVTNPNCNEIINNLCQKRVSCQCEIQMCGKGREIPSALPRLFVAASSDCSKSDYDNVNNEEATQIWKTCPLKTLCQLGGVVG